eukprot:3656953-Pyramimonas_sp.AAC.1
MLQDKKDEHGILVMQLFNIADRKLALCHGESYNSKPNGPLPKNGDASPLSSVPKNNKGKNKVNDTAHQNGKQTKKPKYASYSGNQKPKNASAAGSSWALGKDHHKSELNLIIMFVSDVDVVTK